MKRDRIQEQKKLLIDSMNKLIQHISDNKPQQLEIFHSLSRVDLLKIVNNVEDSNLQLRRVSLRFLCELLYEHPRILQSFIEVLEQPLVEGKLCLTRPTAASPQALVQSLETLRRTPRPEGRIVAWVSKDGELSYIRKDRPEDWQSVDPLKAMVGIFIQGRQSAQLARPKVQSTLQPRHSTEVREVAKSPRVMEQRLNESKVSSHSKQHAKYNQTFTGMEKRDRGGVTVRTPQRGQLQQTRQSKVLQRPELVGRGNANLSISPKNYYGSKR